MSNDRTTPQRLQVPANPTQISQVNWPMRNFYDIDLRFVGKSTKRVRATIRPPKETVFPLERGLKCLTKQGLKSMARKVQ